MTWENIWWFANTNFGAALIAGGLASLAGALGGALAAQKIADKSIRRKLLWDEIKNCNAGIDAAGSICNTFSSLKGQHLVEMKRRYDEQRAAVHAHAEGVRMGRIDRGEGFQIVGVDHSWLPEMKVPVGRLGTVMMEQLSLSGRPRRLANMVLQSVDHANEMIRERNAVIEKIKGLPQNEMVVKVFGLPTPEGVDTTYGDCVEGVWKYSNDVLYYGSELCLELMKYGQKVERRYEKQFRGMHPKTARVDFKTVEARQLIPPAADYAAWEENYVLLVSATEGRWFGKARYTLCKGVRVALGLPWKRRWKGRGLGW